MALTLIRAFAEPAANVAVVGIVLKSTPFVAVPAIARLTVSALVMAPVRVSTNCPALTTAPVFVSAAALSLVAIVITGRAMIGVGTGVVACSTESKSPLICINPRSSSWLIRANSEAFKSEPNNKFLANSPSSPWVSAPTRSSNQ